MPKSQDRSRPESPGDKTGGDPVSADESEAKARFLTQRQWRPDDQRPGG